MCASSYDLLAADVSAIADEPVAKVMPPQFVAEPVAAGMAVDEVAAIVEHQSEVKRGFALPSDPSGGERSS